MNIFKKIGNWFRNYWYYYKWPVVIVGFFAVVIAFCLIQQGKSEPYDVTVLYCGPHIFGIGEKEELENTLEQIMSSDYDGKNGKCVQINDMTAFTDEQMKEALGDEPTASDIMVYSQYSADLIQKNFSQQVFAGDTVICLVDEYWYKILMGANGLVKLEEVLGYRPENLADEYSVRLSDLEYFGFFDAAQKLPEDTLICFRRLSTASAFTGKKAAEKNYGYSKTMLRDLFAFKAP